jgi:hypothetical protein
MATQITPQGTLNKLAASIVWTNYPALTIISSYLLPEGIDMTPEGNATTIFPTLTGTVTSPEPYLMVRFMAHLIKSQPLSNTFKLQMEQSTLLGDCTIWPDVPVGEGLGPYQIGNTAITSVDRLSFAGRDAGWVISFTGYYQINSALWNS